MKSGLQFRSELACHYRHRPGSCSAVSISKWCVGRSFFVGAALRGIGVKLRRFHHLHCALGSLPPLGEGQDEGSWVAAALLDTPSPCPSPARGERTLKRRAGERLNLTPVPYVAAHPRATTR